MTCDSAKDVHQIDSSNEWMHRIIGLEMLDIVCTARAAMFC